MNYFVFVVCGSCKHIEKLNFSLEFLRYFSKYPILVITDKKRNEITINHDLIIDVETPESFDHHQASIYLKTGLFNYLDLSIENTFCYLDSDIVAINEDINLIFENFTSPITFALDHCLIKEFSPHAMNCSCLQDTSRKNNEYKAVDSFFKQDIFSQPFNAHDRIELNEMFNDIRKLQLNNLHKSIAYFLKRYILPLNSFKLGTFTFIKKTRIWYNSTNEFIDFDFNFYANKLKRKTGIKFNHKNKYWCNKEGEDISPKTPKCNHLNNHIKSKYKIDIPADWNHWNGGVFLFNHSSKDFLEYWHKITLDEFNDSKTKTRDQPTLAVCAWIFNLQNSKTLCKEYNFIAEFENKNIEYSYDKGFTADGYKSTFNPCFLHIYHEWGHTGWSIWDYVVQLSIKISSKKIS